MKWFIFLFLLVLFLPIGGQLRTRYQALPQIVHVRRRLWAFGGQRWGVVVSFVRVV